MYLEQYFDKFFIESSRSTHFVFVNFLSIVISTWAQSSLGRPPPELLIESNTVFTVGGAKGVKRRGEGPPYVIAQLATA